MGLRALAQARPLSAGVAYFVSVFVLGFGFGIARTLAMAYLPSLDRVTAVLVELPLILAASWLISAHLVRRFDVPPLVWPRLVMGGAALVLLLAAEAALSLAAGRTLAAHVALYAETSHRLGLIGQIGFGVIPLLQAGLRNR